MPPPQVFRPSQRAAVPPPPAAQPPQATPKPAKRRSPQAVIYKFWSKYHTKTPGKVTSIFPRNLYEALLPGPNASCPQTRNAAQSYEEAREECCAMVRAAVAECERTNTKFTDPDFDIETDFAVQSNNCLLGLQSPWRAIIAEASHDSQSPETARPNASFGAQKDKSNVGIIKPEIDHGCREKYKDEGNVSVVSIGRRPGSVHRLPWIFENPRFTANGYSSSDIKQGSNSACWWLAAVATIAHRKDLMDKVCVARDEECGVYGFVFYRDGQWIPTIVDDNLYLTAQDFGYFSDIYDATGKKARLYKSQKQTGSEALYFGRCVDADATWLPLMEKAFAKVHGDYEALNGGWTGSGVEDLTGGVSTVIVGSSVLRKDKLWRELASCGGQGEELMFSLSSSTHGRQMYKNGLALSHAYSILEATEVEDEEGKKLRLVKIRNPWGEKTDKGLGEWHGPWSDGSREWTPYMIKKLRHEFGDDGIFWMDFDDVLNHFKWIYRTRLFDKRWTEVQQWTSVRVSWLTGYHKTKFIIEVKKQGVVVIALSQLDDRYFRGLEGKYAFTLYFLVRKAGSTTPICQVRPVEIGDGRSVNCELELDPGTYEVIPKVSAQRDPYKSSVEQAVKKWADRNPEKLRQVGLQYDLAHAKGGVLNEDEVVQKKRAKMRKKRRMEKEKTKKMQQMQDAMAKMQTAMAQLRSNLAAETRRSESVKKGTEEKKSEGEGSNKNARFPPGCWPEDSLKADGDIAGSTKTAASPELKSKDTTEQGSKSIDDKHKKQNSGGGVLNSVQDGREATTTEVKKTLFTPSTSSPSSTVSVSSPESSSESDTSSSPDSGPDPDSASSDSDSDSKPKKKKQPWNAVCVIGLRVYAQHEDLTIRLEDHARQRESLGLVTMEGKSVGPTS